MPFRMGPVELIIILVIVMLIFGVGKLPQIGGSMGKAIKEFRKAQDAVSADVLEPETKPEEAEKKVG
jgi:sec-independent protein translocase protein TatA